MLVLFDYKIYCGFFMWVLEILQMQLSFVYIVLVLRN
jgi:hypothetical protein